MMPDVRNCDPSPAKVPGFARAAGVWFFVAWVVVVCASFAYYMLRSFF